MELNGFAFSRNLDRFELIFLAIDEQIIKNGSMVTKIILILYMTFYFFINQFNQPTDMKTFKQFIFLLFLLVSTHPLFAQETEHEAKEEFAGDAKFEKYHKETEEPKKHNISFVIGHAHISTAVKDGKDNEWLTIPSFAFHYSYLSPNTDTKRRLGPV